MAMIPEHGGSVDPALADQEHQYRRFLVEQFERLTFKGISRSGKAISLPLEEIYVELKAVADVPDAADTYSADERRLLLEAEARGIPDGDLRQQLDSFRIERWREEARRGHGRMTRRSIDDAVADPTRPGLVILGDPGSGKTTLLHYLALRAAREGLPTRGGAAALPGAELRSAKGDPRLPIFVPLAAYDDWLRRDHEPLSLNDFLPIYYDTWCSRAGLGPLFREALTAGRALVLLDGLDEVLDVTTRRHIANQVRALIQGEALRGNRFVVTSRIVGYREAQLSGDLPHVTVLDFGEPEIEAFARKWCLACEVWLAGGQPTGVALRRASQEEKELLAEVRANPSVLRLAANPLLLTMLALLRRQGGKLPDERVRLYERYIDMLLDSNWESARSDGARTRAPTRFDRNLATAYLIELALWLQRYKPSGTARRQDLEGALVEIALQMDGLDALRASPKDRQEAREKASLFLNDMRHFAGLLAERGQDAFGFLHLTFQEYFAGRALARMDPEERWLLLKENLHRPRWREPILLCAGQLGIVEGRNKAVSDLGRRILGARSPHEEILHRDVLLASAMAMDGVGFDRSLLDELTWRLSALADDPVSMVRLEALSGLVKLARLSHQGAQAWLEQRIREKARPEEIAPSLAGALWEESLTNVRRALGEWLDESDFSRWRIALETLKSTAASDAWVRSLLIDKLNNKNETTPWMVVNALGALTPTDTEVRDLILERLNDPDDIVREEAVSTLGAFAPSDRKILELVLLKTNDNDETVRQAAITSLSPAVSSDREVRDLMLLKLNDADEMVRQAAIAALSSIAASDQGARAALLGMLDATDAETRIEAVHALKTIALSNADVRGNILKKLADPEKFVQQQTIIALEPLATLNADFRNALLYKMSDTDGGVRQAAIAASRTLALFDEEIRDRLIAHLDDPFPQARTAAIATLKPLAANNDTIRDRIVGTLHHTGCPVIPDMIQALAPIIPTNNEIRRAIVKRLNDSDASVRVAATQAFGPVASSDAEIRFKIFDRLDDQDRRVRMEAMRTLTPLASHDPQIRGLFLDRLDNADEGVRATAVQALELLASGDLEIRQLIIEKLGDSDSVVRAAVAALTPLNTNSNEPRDLANKLNHVGRIARLSIMHMIGPAISNNTEIRRIVLEKLDDPDESMRVAAVHALGAAVFRDSEIRRLILDRLDDGDEGMRAAAVHALGALVSGDTEARRLVLGRIDDPYESVRVAVVHAVEALIPKDVEIRGAILGKLEDPSEFVRQFVVRALRTLASTDAESHGRILSKLEDPSTAVRRAAVDAAGPLRPDDTETHKAIRSKINDESFYVRCAAVRALAPLVASGTEPPQHLIEWFGVVDEVNSPEAERTRRRLADAFAVVAANDPQLSKHIMSMLRSTAWPERKSAAWALIAMPGGPPQEALCDLQRLLDDERGEESWPARLEAAAVLVNERDSSINTCAIAAVLEALDYATKPWYNCFSTAGRIRAQAAQVLGNLEPIYWSDAIFTRLTRVLQEDADESVRDAAYKTLLRLAVSPEAEHDIEALLKPPPHPAEQPSKPTPPSTAMLPLPPSAVLHLSDLHFGTRESAAAWYSQLAEDLRGELSCARLDAVILSGDIANQSTPEEYDAARLFLEKLCGEFQLSPQQVIPVPGNHDLHWGLAKKAYKLFERDDYSGKLEDGHFIDIGSGAVRVRDEDLYPRRFEHFARFYEDLRGEPYPLSPEQQGLLYRFPAQRLLVLGLNSAWNLDHHFRARAAIHPQALSRALDQLRSEPATRDWLKIAVWHHPVNSAFEDRIKDHGFLERLAGADFRLGLHGHIHKAQNGLYRYDVAAAGRRLELVCAGTFGAPTHEWVPGYPLQYQLLRFEGGTLTVETRRREEINGTWKPDARWTAGRGKDPAPRYQLAL
ncbi:HEAT repeat domain-containing protein [Sorangium sp. So ce341]|uniref:HEAT repeat domain-containing protein n=1 Tax=Sorangium sp. So ce341 TaxID=3133302 RepID=UPI003F5E6A9F